MRRLAPGGWRGGVWLLGASLALLLCAGAARAAEVTFHGFVSAAYDYNVNKPASGTNAFRVFDINANSFGIDVAELVVQRAADDKSHVGFRVDVAAGSTVPRVSAARGLFRAADGTGSDFDLQQAFVTVMAPTLVELTWLVARSGAKAA